MQLINEELGVVCGYCKVNVVLKLNLFSDYTQVNADSLFNCYTVIGICRQ